MHEMSLMAEILQLIGEDAKSKGIIYVKKIEVIVGDLSNVLPDALELAFTYFKIKKQDLIDQNTELQIIREVSKAKCTNCHLVFTPDYRIALCPKCGLPICELISGENFRVESYEGSDVIES
ncbi:hydrogenase maturation nickel metallochaperone HypA [Peribacillus acanthi]|uniref:hydrogenase maturation nickel metallochaperone HypA/HybF n=1 Tax=Peribacillus acanthi TaxID=2171554 RepID=UPI000D3E1EB5|nr:hydrogenase maturation nickel metallochaperone HypA [Peribacillus acanthi]